MNAKKRNFDAQFFEISAFSDLSMKNLILKFLSFKLSFLMIFRVKNLNSGSICLQEVKISNLDLIKYDKTIQFTHRC